MHQSWLQGFEEDEPSFNIESKNREELIAREARAVYADVGVILAPIMSLGLSRIHIFDLLKLHQVSVSQDWSIAAIEAKCQTQGTEGFEHPVNQAEYAEFQGFCDAMDVRDFYKEYKRLPNMEGDPVPDDLIAEWESGKFITPPRAQWGKFHISGEYPVSDVASDWHMSAKDVTHLTCAGVVTNQLAFALENGAKLEGGQEFNFWLETARELVRSDRPSRTSLHYVAPKAEGAKVEPRVTASADSLFRQMQRNNEANQKMFNKKVPEIALGASAVQSSRKLHDFFFETKTLHNKVISGHDITGWSVNQSRDIVKDNVDRANRATPMDATDRKVYRDIWDNMMFLLNRGGFERRFAFDYGSMQGYPGHSDSYHHVRIQQFVAHKLREKKLINGSANVRALIDDALMALSLHCKAADTGPTWVEVWNVLCDTYRSLGYQVDQIKSVVGMCKFIFLNEAMYKGLVLPTGLKTLIKAQLPGDIAIPELKESERAIISTAAKAAYVGLAPIGAYFLGVKYALIERNRVCGDMASISSSKAAALALLPEPGWGYPSLAATICVGSGDYYLDSECSIVNAATHFRDPTGSKDFWNTIAGYDNLPTVYTSPLAIMKDSSIVKKDGPISADAVRKRAVSDAMMKSNIQFAEPFKTVIESDRSSAELNAWVNAMVHASMPLPLARAISACSVFAVADQIMDMISISSCLAQFISNRGVMRIRKLVKRQDIVCHRYGCELSGVGADAIRARRGTCATQNVYHQRDIALNSSSIKWTHHTYSHPADLLKVGTTITGTPIGFTAAHILNLSGNRATNRNLEPADCVHSNGIEPGTGGSSLSLEVGSSVVASHPYARKIVMGISLIRIADTNLESQIAKCFFEAWGLTDMSIGASVSICDGSLKRVMGNPQDVDYYPKFGRGIFRGAYVDCNSVFSVCESTVVNVKCLTWYLRHCVALGAVHSPAAMKHGFNWYVSYDPRALIDDSTSGGTRGDVFFPPAVEGDEADWGDEGKYDPGTFGGAKSVFHSLISNKAVHTAITEWNNALKKEAAVVDPIFVAQLEREIPKLAAVMKKSATGFKALRFIPGQFRASDGATLSILRNAAVHHVKQFAQRAEFLDTVNLEHLVNKNSLEDTKPAIKVFGQYKLWEGIKGIVDTGKLALDAAEAYRHVVHSLTGLQGFADLDAHGVAAAVGKSYPALLKLSKTAIEGYSGKKHEDYSIKDRVIIVTREPDRINASERARDLQVISSADKARCQSRIAGLRVLRNQGKISDDDYGANKRFLQGCIMARDEIKYAPDGLVDIAASLDAIRSLIHKRLLRDLRAADDKRAMDEYIKSKKKRLAEERPSPSARELRVNEFFHHRPDPVPNTYPITFLMQLLNEVAMNDETTTVFTGKHVAGARSRMKYAITDAIDRSQMVYAVSPDELEILGVQKIHPAAANKEDPPTNIDQCGCSLGDDAGEQFGFGLNFDMSVFDPMNADEEEAYLANLEKVTTRVSSDEKDMIVTSLEGEIDQAQRAALLGFLPNLDLETLEFHWDRVNAWLNEDSQAELKRTLCGDPIHPHVAFL
jgi:hypothetical protein